MAHASRKEYAVIFVILAVLTALEVAVVKMPIPKTPMVLALVALAITKAACVALFFMHLRTEKRALRYTVALPLLMPPIYAMVLIAESAWRMLPHG
jgi:caa(3)-type oxidase subunit IV